MARRVPTFVAVAVALAAMYVLWPARFGGGTCYVITSGVSMEPLFHSGDLAVLRRDDRYRVGEIAGYRSPTLHVTVLHRIVERRGDRFVFKGDHNTWRDDDRTTQADILGRLWVRIPHGGILIRLARQPAVLLFVGGLVTLGGTSGRRRPGRPRAPTTAGRLGPVDRLSASLPDTLRHPPPWAALTATALGLAVLTLSALTWAMPSRVDRPRLTAFQQRATLSYQARIAPNAAYPSGSLRMPDPIFLSLVPAVDVTVRYDVGQLLARHAQVIGGSYAVVADLRGANGWERSFTLQDETTFTGRSFTTTAELPLAGYLQVINDLERLTNASSAPYNITVKTVVTLSGQVPGGVVAAEFSPSLSFDVTQSQLRLHDQAPAGSASITRSQAGEITVPASVVRRLPVPGHPTPAALRNAGFAFAIVAFLVAGLLRELRRRPAPPDDTAELIPRRYRGRVLATQVTEIPPGRTVVRVDSIHTLHRIAERYGRFIMHDIPPAPGPTGPEPVPGTSRPRRRSTDLPRGREHTFLVDDETALYLFVTHAPAPQGHPPTDPASPGGDPPADASAGGAPAAGAPSGEGQEPPPGKPRGLVPTPRHAS